MGPYDHGKTGMKIKGKGSYKGKGKKGKSYPGATSKATMHMMALGGKYKGK